jgi:hypothetical protein
VLGQQLGPQHSSHPLTILLRRSRSGVLVSFIGKEDTYGKDQKN